MIKTMFSNVFLDYGGLIMDYDFNSNTLLRAHNLALQHINDKSKKQVTLEQLGRAHNIEIQCYLLDRNKTGREKTLRNMVLDILWDLEVDEEALASEVTQIYQENDHNISPMPTTMESIPELRNLSRLGIISNLPHDSIKQELARYGLGDTFNPVVLSCEVGYRKPNKIIYQEALNRAGMVRPERTVFFSHDQEEVDGALAIGMQGYLVKSLAEVLAKLKTS